MERNLELARIFNEIADALEFLGENPYKVRAYRHASSVLENLERDIQYYIDKGIHVEGIGSSIREKIKEFIRTGKISKHEEVLSKVPKGIFEVMSIPGIGPKTARILYEELGVEDIESLRKALDNPKIYSLRGFGKKKVENIKEGLKLYELSNRRHPIGFIYNEIISLKENIANLEGVEKVEVAGSFRRMKETVGDIDILVVAEKDVSDSILSLDNIERILLQGRTKLSFIYSINDKRKIQVDVRIVRKESWGSALQYFTGSKEHNIKLREIAIQKGYKLNEYGLFKEENYIAGRTEEEIYESLGLKYIPPEMRENRGEIELALEGKLPKIVEMDDVRGDTHVHSKYSDGHLSIEEIDQLAYEMGYEYVVIVDHSKSLKVAKGIDEETLFRKIEEVRRYSKRSKVKLLVGAEVEILNDGSLDYKEDVLKELDLVIGAIHNVRKGEDLTERYLKAMENPYMDVLAHPTGRLLEGRKAYPFDKEKVFREAARRRIYLEINAHANRMDLSDTDVMFARSLGCKFSIGTDTHNRRNAWMMILGVGIARRAWLVKDDILNTLDYEAFRRTIEDNRRFRMSFIL